MLQEFKKFLLQGNLIEIAVGLILALEVADVVESLTADIINPILAAVVGEPNFSHLTLDIGDGVITYGNFLNTLISLVLTGLVLFLIVKAYNTAKDALARSGEDDDVPDDIALLREIRDALQERSA